jgi:hypothetical protein
MNLVFSLEKSTKTLGKAPLLSSEHSCVSINSPRCSDKARRRSSLGRLSGRFSCIAIGRAWPVIGTQRKTVSGLFPFQSRASCREVVHHSSPRSHHRIARVLEAVSLGR